VPRHLLTVAEGGVSARIQLKLLLGYASISRLLFRRRGLQRLSWTLGSFFPPRNSVILSQGARQFKIYLKDGYYTRLLPQGFVYEPEVAAILDKVISPDSVFVDCGANNGYWSVYAGLKSGHPERVLAIEPTSEPFARLEENRHLNNDSFRAVKRAIYSKSDVELQFAVHPHQHAMNTSTAWAGGWPADPRSPHELVRSITIDDVCEGMFPNGDTAPVVVKIDVEGHELSALRGLSRPVPFLSFEVNLPEFGPEGLECIRLLADLAEDGLFNYTADCTHGLALKDWVPVGGFSSLLERCNERGIEIFWKSISASRPRQENTRAD